MADFRTVTTTGRPLDPYKRVNYTFGLVLGVDEFQQEQLYHLEKHRLHNRALHGYGTVCGLKVSQRGTTDEIEVTAGIALNPRGEEIRVPLTQCGKLNGWLDRHKSSLTRDGSGNVSVYVTLCYRECQTDEVPIPGEPCRTPEDSMAPSRIADDFTLSFAVTRPAQVEEDGVRRFGDLLRRIVVTDDAAPADYITRDALLAIIRALPTTAPPATPIYIVPGMVESMLRTVFRVWVTEVRGQLVADGQPEGCVADHADERCVLLARLGVPVTAGFVVNGAITVEEDERPYLLHTRLLQEWLLAGHSARDDSDDTLGVIFTVAPNRVRVWLVHDQVITVGATPFVLRVDASDVATTINRPIANVNVFDLVTTTAVIPHLAALRVNVDLAQLSAGGGTLASRRGPSGDYLDRQGNIVSLYAMADLPRLDDLVDVNAPSPNNGDVLAFNATARQWVPARPTGGGTPAADEPTLPLVDIRFVGALDVEGGPRLVYEVWFHLTNQTDPSDANQPALVKDFKVRAFDETESPTQFLEELDNTLRPTNPFDGTSRRNVVYILVTPKETRPDLLRFVFDLAGTPMLLPGGGRAISLLEWMTKLKFKWLGFDGDQSATAYWERAEGGAAAAGPQIVAAGSFSLPDVARGTPLQALKPAFGGLTATFVERLNNRVVIQLKFDAFSQAAHYITTGTILFFNFGFDDSAINPIIALSPDQKDGLEMYVTHPLLLQSEIVPRNALGFMVQIVELPSASGPGITPRRGGPPRPLAGPTGSGTPPGRTPQSRPRRRTGGSQ